jgi:hypothetical protein
MEKHHGLDLTRRRLAHPGRALGASGSASSAAQAASIGLSSAMGERPGGNEYVLFVPSTGAQWNALNATGICSSSSAHRRFQECVDAGVFEASWRCGLLAVDMLEGIDWTWPSLDGAMTKAPLGGEKNRAQSYGWRERRRQTQHAH